MLAQRATWRSGDAADCKSAHPGSIPGVASRILPEIQHLSIPLARMARQRRRACWDNCWDNRSVFFLHRGKTTNVRSIRRRSLHLQICCVSSCISSSRETRVSRGSSLMETGTMHFKTRLLPAVLGWAMVAIGLCAMATVMWMTGRFGWSLQEATADRWASASLHLLNDAAGAILVAASGVMLNLAGWRTRVMGLIALPCALVLVAYSIVSVYGFMSTRITQLESHKNTVAWQRGELDWKRKTSVSREVAKSDRVLLRAEAHLAAKQLKESLQFVPDAQATGIAAWFDTSVERIQRALVITTSCIGQLIKVACIFFGFSFLSYRAAAEAKGMAGSESAGDSATGPTGRQFVHPQPYKSGKHATQAGHGHHVMGHVGHVGHPLGQVTQVDPVSQLTSLKSTSIEPPKEKWPRQQVVHLLGQVGHLEPRRSTRSIASETGWARRTLDRMRCRLVSVDPAPNGPRISK